jgi:HAD superfamily hydrolase (TIGR01459 family)
MKIKNIFEIADNYELFILDLFGVIHDGNELYPNSIATVKKLREMGKKICFLSNAPRRAVVASQKLIEFGIIEGEDYEHILTSGEHAFHSFKALQENNEIIKYFYFGPEKDHDLLRDLKHEEVTDVKEADLAISTGLEPHQTVDDVEKELDMLYEQGLEVHCINPDKFVHKKSGRSHICAGAIAEKYISMGGEVSYYGKPYSGIYQEVLTLFPEISKEKILCVGDGMDTDIMGANNAHLDSLLISSGMHRSVLETEIGEVAKDEKIQLLFEEHLAKPTYISSLF